MIILFINSNYKPIKLDIAQDASIEMNPTLQSLEFYRALKDQISFTNIFVWFFSNLPPNSFKKE